MTDAPIAGATFAVNMFQSGDIVIYAGDSVALTITSDGAVVIGPGLKPDEAGCLAAESLARAFPDVVASAVAAERERCAAIVQLAREGEIDGDFRSLIYRIRNP